MCHTYYTCVSHRSQKAAAELVNHSADSSLITQAVVTHRGFSLRDCFYQIDAGPKVLIHLMCHNRDNFHKPIFHGHHSFFTAVIRGK